MFCVEGVCMGVVSCIQILVLHVASIQQLKRTSEVWCHREINLMVEK